VVAAALSACGTSSGSSSPNDNTSKGLGNAASAAPALPSKLPAITTEDKVEQTMRDLIAVAAQQAVGAPDSDRHPTIVATSDSACGVKVKAITCPPADNASGSAPHAEHSNELIL
jgi:hypothetical protein